MLTGVTGKAAGEDNLRKVLGIDPATDLEAKQKLEQQRGDGRNAEMLRVLTSTYT